jgi:DNA replication and repair protein RecF
VLVSGPNGAGKTNLLEALHLGTQGFSPRARGDVQMLRFGSDAGRVGVAGVNGASGFETDVTLRSREPRRVRLNGSVLASAEQLRHELLTLVFTPDRLAVVKGGPGVRRSYLDRSLGRFFPSRASLPLDYAAALGQRNAALRRAAARASSLDAIEPWTEAVLGLGSALVEVRRETLALLCGPFSEYAYRLGLPEAAVVYEGEAPTRDELEHRLERDLERGSTGAGPHLHDVRLEAGCRELRGYGSQGEQRICVLALVLAEATALCERRGTAPLVLLDDVLSELDGDRRRALGELISGGGQTVVTAAAAAALPTAPDQSVAVGSGTARGI